MFKKFREKVYRILVRDHDELIYCYTIFKYKHQFIYKYFRFIVFIYFFILVFKLKVSGRLKHKDMIFPESLLDVYPDQRKLLKKIASADVISFDVFDTLLLRVTDDPLFIFDIVGMRLNIKGYRQKRVMAEQLAGHAAKGHAKLKDICRFVEKLCGVNAELAYRTETDVEKECCRANPYFLKLFNAAKFEGKVVIAVSDMYLSSDFINELLSRGGFKVSKVYVSCEYNVSKADTELWEIVKKDHLGKKIFHIGDNFKADVVASGKAGIVSLGVFNLAQRCFPYRNCGVRSLSMSIYNSLIDRRLHAEDFLGSCYYEHGYVYGGLMVYGFCNWLHEYALCNDIDLLLFTARDSRVFYEIYTKFFGNKNAHYLYISRLAAMKVGLHDNFDMFLDIMFAAKARRDRKITISQALNQADIGFLKNALTGAGIDGAAFLDECTIRPLSIFLMNEQGAIEKSYMADKTAFGAYLAPMIAGRKKICVVDLGWRGTVFILLHSYLKNIGSSVEVKCAMFGATDNALSDILIDNEDMETYAFSNKHNVNYLLDDKTIMLMEMMFADNEPTTVGYEIEEGHAVPRFGKAENEQQRAFSEIRAGIYDFCNDFMGINNSLFVNIKSMGITGAEAFAPLFKMLGNVAYNKHLYANMNFSAEPNAKCEKLGNYLKKVKYK